MINKSLSAQIVEANRMLESVEDIVTENTYLLIRRRIDSWSLNASGGSQAKKTALPPLVMRPGSIPRPLNPLFFKLKK